jgi:hypothetical protein
MILRIQKSTPSKFHFAFSWRDQSYSSFVISDRAAMAGRVPAAFSRQVDWHRVRYCMCAGR